MRTRRSLSTEERKIAQINTDGKIYAIGDIHGCYDELLVLMENIYQEDDKDSVYVFIGDYIDRGPKSKEVIDWLISFKEKVGDSRCYFLRGNHEDMLCDYLGYEGKHGMYWIDNGARSTLRSYAPHDQYGYIPTDEIKKFIPEKHIDFLLNLYHCVISDKYFFVHAGFSPYVDDIFETSKEDLCWIRKDFILSEKDFGKIVVYGHTSYKEVSFAYKNKIGIDTGCVYKGALSCIELPSRKTFSVKYGSQSVSEKEFHLPAS